jgi:heptosyltransferase-2
MSSMKFTVKKVVLVAPTWLGDAVMSLPLVGLLAEAPGVHTTILSRHYAARVYLGLDAAKDVVVTGNGGRVARIWGQARWYRRVGVDGAVILPPSYSSALGVFLGGVRERCGVSSDGRGALLTASLDEAGRRDEHLSETYVTLGRMLLERLGLPSDHEYRRPGVVVMERDREELDGVLRKAGLGGGDYAVVVPGATFGPAKSWPREKYRALVKNLSAEIPVVLGGSRAERDLCEAIANGGDPVVNLAGATGLGAFLALLAGARAVIANDSGAPHLAAAMGVPVVVIFGSTSPTWTAPLGPYVRVIRNPVHCSPCFLKECPTQLECYDGITVDEVLACALEAVGKKSDERTDS